MEVVKDGTGEVPDESGPNHGRERNSGHSEPILIVPTPNSILTILISLCRCAQRERALPLETSAYEGA